jgi:hypothetical protein
MQLLLTFFLLLCSVGAVLVVVAMNSQSAAVDDAGLTAGQQRAPEPAAPVPALPDPVVSCVLSWPTGGAPNTAA